LKREILPYIERCESDVRVSLNETKVYLKFSGMCPSCPFLYSHLFPVIREMIINKFEEVEEVILEEE